MRRTFTLIEVLIALMLFSFFYFVMVDVLGNLKKSESVLQRVSEKEKSVDRLIKVLYSDLLRSQECNITKIDDHYTHVVLHTKHSLYDLVDVYVEWYVNVNGLLVRQERLERKKKPDFFYYVIPFGKWTMFRIFLHENNVLVYLQRGEKSYAFEVQMPMLPVKRGKNR